MQKFEFLRQPLLGELAMSRKREREREKNAIYSGHLRLCQQPRAAHALRSDQFRGHCVSLLQSTACTATLGPTVSKDEGDPTSSGLLMNQSSSDDF